MIKPVILANHDNLVWMENFSISDLINGVILLFFQTLLLMQCYLMVMISPGLALMFQLQLMRDGYSKGQPGLVITPLDALICSATSPQAKVIQTNIMVRIMHSELFYVINRNSSAPNPH